MALVDITIDFDLAQILGADFDARRTKAYVTTNVESGTLMDTTTGETRLGDEAVTINSDGTGAFTTWATGADGNPISWQTSLVIDYPRTGQRDRKRRAFGPWTLTTADDGKNIVELEDEQAVPPEYLTTVTTALQTYVDAGQAAATTAAAASTTASGAADTAVNAAGLASEIALGDADAAFGVAQLNPASPLSVAQGDVLGDPTHPLTAGLAGTYARGLSVTDPRFGAVGDGTTDDSAAIQAAIDATVTAGGGEVYIPAGTYRIVTTLVIYSKVTLRGAGREATILKLGNSANTTILRTESFSTLTGTDPTTLPYGPGLFTICDMTFDGNKANNTSGWCAQIYAWDFTIERVTFRQGKSGGLYTEWTTGSGPDPADNVEARLNDVKAHQNDGYNIHWDGPHDSIWTNVVTNRGTTAGVYVGAGAFGLQVTGFHTWGASQNYGLVVMADGCQFLNAVSEGAITAQVLYAADTGYIDGFFYAAGSVGTGIQLGIPAGTDASNVQVRGRWSTFAAGAVNYANDGGGCDVDIVVPGGLTVSAGTPHPWTTYRYRVPGTGWTTYTPTLTASTTDPTIGTTGNITTGAYMTDGKTTTVRVQIKFGTTAPAAGTGTYYVSLPVPRKSAQFAGGNGFIYDASTFDQRLIVLQEGSTTSNVAMVASGAPGAANVTAASPWTWSAEDQIRFTLTYENV